ncbi:UDP-N-acetylmuramoyl-tripeptide--D-alanyl-D-alanine ligase [Candidatus Kuenenia stuttgartensis]|jgi:UDP-N-acetylmuramoyl-tripeptide--D-alanyl-D-alanine ligase|uniref:UDP-N-acetylmuramoyl-tripeptide--D-alanyl-D-alanine ligase n=2 Tax=Candidatus Kuenenia TaxID=380738 RepID=Q1Q6D2_KUEST|nr:UDP-N-acetylmuramoyl-tripeptide--D-alanyl-D-alanine ligase [Candidatus Kuenenia stuttgartiensis]CAJ73125.1 similar to UDP-N-acetylmuramoylalanyl-D-glutamyl-2,6-diaminopimelate--D-alanyl-D-alanine ligase [Candidatus Kuenenia stuttgartiensis]
MKMDAISLEEVIQAVNGKAISNVSGLMVNGVSVDSRNVHKGNVFFAIKGDHYDGRQFIEQAFDAGAIGVVVSKQGGIDISGKCLPLILVDDVKTALGDLARHYRRKLNAKIIGITGSNGKTTTKEMLYHLLSHFAPVVKPQKSFNNFIGVPLTIFEIESKHKYGILEMGTNAPGEILRLSEIGLPDIAVILNISKTHLEGLGSIEGVALEKGDILKNLKENGVFVYNADNPLCCEIADKFGGNKISFGLGQNAQIRGTDAKKKGNGSVFTIDIDYNTFRLCGVKGGGRRQFEIQLQVPGHHNISNCLASFAVCHALGLDISGLYNAFLSFKMPDMRIDSQQIGNVTFINDAYNANPESVFAALKYFEEIDAAGRKIFICGDMLELGKESHALHKELGEKASTLNLDLLWTVGKYASDIAGAAKDGGMDVEKVLSFRSLDDITEYDMGEFRENDVILIKGSRGMHMETIIDKYREYFSPRVLTHN